MEQKFKLKTNDGHTIYSTLSNPSKKSSLLVVFVHGLTGHSNEHLFYNGARYLVSHGIASLRFELYSWEKGARKLHECSISTHAEDLAMIIKYFRKRFKKIVVIGHSLGGVSILLSNINLMDGIVLWDSSTTFTQSRMKDIVYNQALDAYITKWGVENILSKRMVKEWTTLPRPRKLAAKVNMPLLVAVAGKGALIKRGKEYYKYAQGPKMFAIIKGAGHNFYERDSAYQLFSTTYQFIRKYFLNHVRMDAKTSSKRTRPVFSLSTPQLN